MTKEQQDLTWAYLPNEVREEIKEIYQAKVGTAYDAETYQELILDEIFGEHNLISYTEPQEMLMVERKKVQNLYNTYNNPNWASNGTERYCADVVIDLLDGLFGDECLPDEELEQSNLCDTCSNELKDSHDCSYFASCVIKSCSDYKPKEQPKPKFKVGDKVRVIDNIRAIYPNPMTIKGVTLAEDGKYRYNVVEYGVKFHEDNLEPYTEENKEPMEEKELNLCELLKGCEGIKLYTTPYGELVFREMDEDFITLGWDGACGVVMYHINGRLHSTADVVTIYPSRALYEKYPLDPYSAWMEWKESRKPKRWRAKLGEKYWVVDIELTPTWSEEKNDGYDKARYNNGNYFRTKEEAKQAAEAVRETLEKFHEKHSEK